MSTFKCKMCGGALNIENNASIATCEYCGTTQTLPRIDDERKANLYDRANHFRRNNEFDKAMGIYEQILNEDVTDSEAYWSLVLCRYGIEYVEDPSTHKRVPTVNRAQFTSVFDDDNYKSALEYADGYQKSIYEQEANAINEIQKGILAISQKEEPFDVFICYKETDNNGRRTPDSVLANDLYHQLTQEGFKVFFARITLEDKLGSAYEPYIFAALNSAKVMVVLGTKPEFFNAVWVKNEWSRYLALIKQGQKKMLIPAYKDMDPYDLPEEFSHLQAQDMSKLGFMQDLIRGIKKIAEPEQAKQTVVKETFISGTNVNTEPLLKRAFMFLEDGDWTSAGEYCEKVLDIDPENATAYLGELMAGLQVRNQESLKDLAEPFDNNGNYQKVIRFADENLKNTLVGYIEHINARNETARKDDILSKGKEKMNGENISDYESAIKLFESVSGWKDADEKVCECKNKIEEIKAKAEATRKEAEKRSKRNERIAGITTISIVCVIIVVAVLLYSYEKVIVPNGKYNDALVLMDEGNIVEAYESFVELGEYKDSKDKASVIYDEYKSEKLKNPKVGDYVFFGTYEQDNDTSNGNENIEWLVLEVKDGKALVISKYALDCKPYNTEWDDVTWEKCSLRQWLNNDFLNSAFSEDEQKLIPTVTVTADENPDYDTDPGNDTKDKVFLLSITEVNKYFNSDSVRQCKSTNYAEATGAYTKARNCLWWLRSPGFRQRSAAGVNVVGDVLEDGDTVDLVICAVRPALWINLDA